MERKDKIKELQSLLLGSREQQKVWEDELRELQKEEQIIIEERYKKAFRGEGNFTEEELRYAAYRRCCCGAGLAYPIASTNMHDMWRCSAILKGEADRKVQHDEGFPFAFYAIKSELQPSAQGATTRPIKE